MSTDRLWKITNAPILGLCVRDDVTGNAVIYSLGDGVEFASNRVARVVEYAPTLLRLLDTLVNNHPSMPGYEHFKDAARRLVKALNDLDPMPPA